MKAHYSIPGGQVVNSHDYTLNDSDKSFTVPPDEIWELIGVTLEIVATATAGNRVLKVIITDGTNTLWTSYPSANIAANTAGQLLVNTNGTREATARAYFVTPANTVASSVCDGQLPRGLKLLPGSVIRCYDSAAIDAAADDLRVVLHYIAYQL